MPRYIDADKYIEYLEKEMCAKCIDEVCGACGLDSAKWIAGEFSTADVAQKSEVAMEIFEDIEFEIHQLWGVQDEHRADAIERVIAELKKEYTEGKT